MNMTQPIHTVLSSMLISALAVLFLGGCASESKPSPMPPVSNVQEYFEPEERYQNPGSLFTESSPIMLFEDSRARRVGDIVLVKIVENTKAKNKADTTANRKTATELGVSAAFGRSSVSPLLYGGNLLSGKVSEDVPIVSASSNSSLSGTGETKRENTVSTTLAARVVQALPNGLLKVEGAREIRVNEETEYMVISGLVHKSAILSDNSVLSTQMAESTISYYGKGVLADKQKAGWLTRLLDTIWPF